VLTERTYVITGASSGVGRATARALAQRGAKLVLACRSEERARDVLAELASIGGPASWDLVEIDLGSLASVRRAANEIAARAPRIDVLVNNAGVGGARGMTQDGFEIAFGVNHLGHYLLTRLLAPRIREGGRIVHLSSGSHFAAREIAFDALRRPTASLTGIAEYAVSKLCVMLFHHELGRRMPGIESFAADPGDVASNAWRHVPWPVRPFLTWGMQSPEEGARTSLLCATDEALSGAGGGFYVDGRASQPSPLSLDRTLAAELWERSAEWTGLAS
jgi:NAD(P)-dependent dehydrogenase (short-subunit alcohol dehydrogenase family)